MATPAQLLANRLNSQKSTGPRSDEGKAASRMNALKHGARAASLIIPGEDPEVLAGLTASYREHYQPQGPEEELLLDTIVRAAWTQRRMARLEAEVFNSLVSESDPPETALGLALQRDAAGANALQKIFRRDEAAHRQWHRARKELALLQANRRTREFHADLRERTQSPAPVPRTASQSARSDSPVPAVRPPESANPAKAGYPAPAPRFNSPFGYASVAAATLPNQGQ